MHSFKSSKGTGFSYNGDLSGSVVLFTGDHPPQARLEVPGIDLLDFIAHWLRDQQVSRLENSDPLTLLGVDPAMRKP